MTTWAVIAARPLTEGKARLAGVLTPSARWSLNAALLSHVAEVVQAVFGHRAALVSRSHEVLALGLRAGLFPILESDHGLNEAFSEAAAEVGRHGADAMLALPTDLPMLSPDSLKEMLAARETGAQVVIAPDRHGLGTNALLTPLPPLRFSFGPGSRHAHERAAAARGWRSALLVRPGLAWDVDTPDDLAAMAALPGGWQGMADDLCRGGPIRCAGHQIRPAA
jgi:2-phospho-L-lactate guanylyltransferase